MWWGSANESMSWNAAVLRVDMESTEQLWGVGKMLLEDMDHLFKQQAGSVWGWCFEPAESPGCWWSPWLHGCWCRTSAPVLVGLRRSCQKADVQEEPIWVRLPSLTYTEAAWVVREVAGAAGLEVFVHRTAPGVSERQPHGNLHHNIYLNIKTKTVWVTSPLDLLKYNLNIIQPVRNSIWKAHSSPFPPDPSRLALNASL